MSLGPGRDHKMHRFSVCLLLVAGLLVGPASEADTEDRPSTTVTLLFTNDVESAYDPIPAFWLDDQEMEHVRGAPNHPQTQGKIERWHQTLKNRILLENYYLPGALEQAIGEFIDHYNHHRYHESLGNLTPADVYFGRAETILSRRKEIKNQTIQFFSKS